MTPQPTGVAMRTLVLMLDGVPFGIVDSLWKAGRFADFQPPSRVISPFPAITQVAFGSVWRTPPPGYEDRYYDATENRIEGGLLDHVLRPAERTGFRRYIEVQPGGLPATLAYLLPRPMARLELRQLRDRVIRRAAYDTTVVAYLVASDALAHRTGRDGVVAFLGEVESLLAELRSRYGPALDIMLFSDHGNELVATRRAPLEEALESSGFDIVHEIEDDNDVVVPAFGLVGSAFFYTWPAAEPKLAEALRRAPGVELVVFEDGLRRVHVLSRTGRAILEADSAVRRLRYRPIEGDPLGLVPGLQALERAGVLSPDGFAPDSAWLRVRRETPFIDSPHRLIRGMRALVEHPASVMVSFEPGFHFGSRVADVLVDVTGTHGSLRTESALAFFMGSHTQAPSLLRSEALLRYVPVDADRGSK